MAGLRHFLKEINETRLNGAKLLAAEQSRLVNRYAEMGHGVVLRRPSADLLGLINTQQELETVARVCSRAL